MRRNYLKPDLKYVSFYSEEDITNDLSLTNEGDESNPVSNETDTDTPDGDWT